MKYKIEWKYKVKGIQPVQFDSELLSGEVALQIGEELEKSGKAIDLTFYDELGTDWNLKQLRKLLAETEDDACDILVYFDGGFQKENKRGGLGVVIYFHQGKKKYRIRVNEVFDEMETNNEVEYAAFFFALNVLEEMGVHHLPCEFRGDSQVVLKQLEGEWPCFEEVLNSWLDRIEQKLEKLAIKPKYTPIPRNENKEADKLATQALEGKMVQSKMQII
jgi:ribonuclease HI